MKRDIEFVNGHFYHVYNRGVLKNKIFNDSADYARFVHYLYEFNDISRVRNTFRYLERERNVRRRASHIRELLVDIVCWCLMPNHFHLILRQIVEDGIHKFVHKVETGHAKYFNTKYNRSGVFYEGRFKANLIEEDEYLTHLSRYIHLNPVALVEPGWKENGIKDWEAVIKFLEGYKWSSHLDYIGKHNFPSIINKEPMTWYFKNPEEYMRFLKTWGHKDLYTIEDLIIDDD